MGRVRLWLGILALVASSYLIFDPAGRFSEAWERLIVIGPWALVALAVVNLGRAVARSAFVYLGPGLLAFVGAATLMRPRLLLTDISDLLLSAVIVGAAASVVTALPVGQTWTSFLWSGRASAPPLLIGRMRAVAVLGEVRLDLLNSQVQDRMTLVAVAFGGRVVIDLPREWRVLALPPASTMLAVREQGRRETTPGEPQLEVRLLGLGGALELRWH